MVVCANGEFCRAGAYDLCWNCPTESRWRAEQDLLELDDWYKSERGQYWLKTTSTAIVEELQSEHPELNQPAKCGPHRVVQYRPVEEPLRNR